MCQSIVHVQTQRAQSHPTKKQNSANEQCKRIRNWKYRIRIKNKCFNKEFHSKLIVTSNKSFAFAKNIPDSNT